tara:strand:+ start:282 stop:470 length:189 start_codon:yes stop_codon:yes gene_type:complete
MIQLTQWIDPNDKIWCNRTSRYINNAQWLKEECIRIQNKKNCSTIIETNSSGHQAIFREKLK